MNICMADINGVNGNESIYIKLKEHMHIHPYFFPSDSV